MFGPLALLLSTAALGAVVNGQPAWSPDGNWIAFTRDDRRSVDGIGPQVWITNGTTTRRLVRDGGTPSWSPNGQKIVFVGADAQLQVVAVAGGAAVRLWREDGGCFGSAEPSWSPDGKTIAYACQPPEDSGWTIATRNVDGEIVGELASSELGEPGWFWPAWSPDSSHVAFVGEEGGIYAGDRDGRRDAVLLTRRSTAATHPSWSPDGGRIVFAAARASDPGGFQDVVENYAPLSILDLHTKKTIRLTRMLGDAPAWSPGGRRIAFAARARDGSTQIFLVDPDGSHLKQLTRN